MSTTREEQLEALASAEEVAKAMAGGGQTGMYPDMVIEMFKKMFEAEIEIREKINQTP